MQCITLLCTYIVQKYIYPSVSNVYAGSFRACVIHRTLTWTTWFLKCIHDHSHAWVYIRGLGTLTASQHNMFVLCSWRGSNLGSLNLESAALTTEPPRHPELLWQLGFLNTLLSLSGNLGRLTRVRLQQPQEQRYPVLQVHAVSFRVSVIHRTLAWAKGSLTCEPDHSYAAYTHGGLGTPTASQHNIFDTEKLSHFSCAPDRAEVRTFGLWISSPTLYQLSHPATQFKARSIAVIRKTLTKLHKQ